MNKSMVNSDTDKTKSRVQPKTTKELNTNDYFKLEESDSDSAFSSKDASC